MSDNRTLLIVQNNSYPFDNRVFKESVSLSNHGYLVSIISPQSLMDVLEYQCIGSIEVYRYKNLISDGSFFGFIKEYSNAVIRIYSLVFKLLQKNKIDVIHVANPPDIFWPLAMICRCIKIKFIYDQHDMAPEMYKIRFGRGIPYCILLLFEFLTVKLANIVFVTNQSFIQRSMKLWGGSPKKFTVIFNGPVKAFTAKHNPDIAAKYNDCFVILYIGLMSKNDNIEIIIEAAKRIALLRGNNKYRFVLLGSGDVEEKMKVKAKDEGVEDIIEFKGYVDHQRVKEYLDIAKVCLIPDLPNGMNEHLTHVKVLEYLKAGKPFVGFRLEETMSIAGEAGFYANDIDEYVEKIKYLHDHPEVSARMGSIGRETVEKTYLWEYSEEKMLEAYQLLLSRIQC